MQRGAIHFFGFFLNLAIFRFDLPLFIQEAYINYVLNRAEWKTKILQKNDRKTNK